MRNVSDTYKEESGKQQTGETFLLLLQAYFPSDGNTYYYVNNYEPIDSVDMKSGSLVTYQPAAFSLDPGEHVSEEAPDVSLQFDGADRDFLSRLEKSSQRPTFNISLILSSDPDNFEFGPVEYRGQSFDVSPYTINVTMETLPILNEQVPATKFTSFLFSGLYKDTSFNDI